jgi:branched-chain amino acid transport system permease protein
MVATRAKRVIRLEPTDIFIYIVGGLIILAVVVGSIATLSQGKYSTAAWADLLVFGLATGSIYSLIALGYTMVYGILRMINFAHSEVFMCGPFTAYFLAEAFATSGFLNQHPGISLVLVFALSMGISILVTVLLERIAYRPLRYAPRLVPLITAIGASFFLTYTFRGLYGTQIKVYPEIEALKGQIMIGAIRISYVQILVIVSAAVMMLGLQLFVQRSRTGKAIRAVAEDRDTAALMGINVNNIIVTTFILGGALAGAAGVLYALMFSQVNAFMGFVPGIKAFTAAVLGGIGNIPGAMIGGLFLGVIESIGPTLFLDGLGIAAPYQLKDAIAFSLLVLVLIFRPTGILGERIREKKA